MAVAVVRPSGPVFFSRIRDVSAPVSAAPASVPKGSSRERARNLGRVVVPHRLR
jgi:hypothetical protein